MVPYAAPSVPRMRMLLSVGMLAADNVIVRDSEKKPFQRSQAIWMVALSEWVGMTRRGLTWSIRLKPFMLVESMLLKLLANWVMARSTLPMAASWESVNTGWPISP